MHFFCIKNKVQITFLQSYLHEYLKAKKNHFNRVPTLIRFQFTYRRYRCTDINGHEFNIYNDNTSRHLLKSDNNFAFLAKKNYYIIIKKKKHCKYYELLARNIFRMFII